MNSCNPTCRPGKRKKKDDFITLSVIANGVNIRRGPNSVTFSSPEVEETNFALEYDRTCFAPNLFDCDICGVRIAAGIKGFDTYYRCTDCPDFFDVCSECYEGKKVDTKIHSMKEVDPLNDDD